jgi:ketosteroid isomerase-like protein
MNAQVAHFWTLDGGKVAQFQQLVDPLAVTRCTGAV